MRTASKEAVRGTEREAAAKWRVSNESQRRISACVSWVTSAAALAQKQRAPRSAWRSGSGTGSTRRKRWVSSVTRSA